MSVSLTPKWYYKFPISINASRVSKAEAREQIHAEMIDIKLKMFVW